MHGLNDGKTHLAWTCIVHYNVTSEDGYDKPAYREQIFARANGKAGHIQIHSLIYGSLAMNTKNCNLRTTSCNTFSTEKKIPIKPRATMPNANDSVHKYAIDTHNNNRKYNNSFWDGSQMTHIHSVVPRPQGHAAQAHSWRH
jgi:hypothetical protein